MLRGGTMLGDVVGLGKTKGFPRSLSVQRTYDRCGRSISTRIRSIAK
jgi:hypothetical protein